MEFRSKFIKVGGERIPDIIEYLKERIKINPNLTISVGCDSSQKKRRVAYAITIMMHDRTIRNGAHVVFFRIYEKGKMDIYKRLYKEGEIIFALSEFIDSELLEFYTRKDLDDDNIKKYKLHLEQHKGNHMYLDFYQEMEIIKSMPITKKDRETTYKLCDVHLDYNIDFNDGRNKSHNVYKSVIPWFKSSGYRVWCKPYSHASTSAADLLVK